MSDAFSDRRVVSRAGSGGDGGGDASAVRVSRRGEWSARPARAAARNRTQGLPQYLKHRYTKLELPNYGNYVSHDVLFHQPPHPAPATRVRAWRKRPEIYAARFQGVINPIQPLALQPNQQIADFSSLYTVDKSATEIIISNAQRLVERWTLVKEVDGQSVPVDKTVVPAVLLPILQPQPPTAEQFSAALQHSFQFALERDATTGELERIRKLYDRVAAEHGRVAAGRAALTVPLLLPEAVYRLELGSGPLDEHGRRRLSKAEILQTLQQTLFGAVETHPEILAVRNDATASLATGDEVAALVRKLLATKLPRPVMHPGVSPEQRPRVLTFFDEYFDYGKAVAVFKDQTPGVTFSPQIAGYCVRETQLLVQKIVEDDRDVFRKLLTSNRMHLSSGTYLHGVDPPARMLDYPADWKRRPGFIELAPDAYAGVLTHPSWLVAHSLNDDNDLARRGKWVLERLLGGTVPELPLEICAIVPQDAGKTLRERLSMIREDAYCWRCHRQMNQLGTPFEAYDHFGRHRLKELKRPVDTTGAIVDSGDASLDGPVSDAVEMLHRIANSERGQQVFVRYVFRYFLGRNETPRDALTLQQANRAYSTSEGSLRALLTSLLSSDSYLYRHVE